MKQDKSIARPIVTLSLVILLQIAAFTAQAPVVSAKQPECNCFHTKSAPMQATNVSFAATEYKNSEYGFSVKYPASWQNDVWGNAGLDRQAGMLLVARGKGSQRLVVGARQGATLADALTAVFKDAGASTTTIDRSTDTRLADGTPATWIAYFTKSAGMSLSWHAVGAQRGDTWVFAAVACRSPTPTDYEAQREWNSSIRLFSEILGTLKFESSKADEGKPEPSVIDNSVSGKLSFEAVEYVNAEHGFSMKYPKDWQKFTPSPELLAVFAAQCPTMSTRLYIFVANGYTLADALKAVTSGHHC